MLATWEEASSGDVAVAVLYWYLILVVAICAATVVVDHYTLANSVYCIACHQGQGKPQLVRVELCQEHNLDHEEKMRNQQV